MSESDREFLEFCKASIDELRLQSGDACLKAFDLTPLEENLAFEWANHLWWVERPHFDKAYIEAVAEMEAVDGHG